MTTKELNLQGAAAVSDAIKSGRCLGKEMSFMAKFIRSGQADIFSGAVSALLSAVIAVRDRGLLQKFADEDLNEFFFGKSYARMALDLNAAYGEADKSRFERLLSYMAGVVNTYRHCIRMTPIGTSAAGTPEVAPIDVRIVGLPTRTAIQSVERDENDEISRTLTVTSTS